VDVAVDDFPLAIAGADTTVCSNVQGIALNGIIRGGTTTGVWTSFGTGKFVPSSDVLNATYVPSQADLAAGTVTLRLTSTSKDDCKPNFSDKKITILPAPIANGGGNRDVCTQDVSIQMNGTAKNAASVRWTTTGTGTFTPSAARADALYIPSKEDITEGSVQLSFRVAGTGCDTAVDKITIRFVPPPTVNAGGDLSVIRGQFITLNPTVSDDNVQYRWTPSVNLSSDTVKNPVVKGVQDQTYTLRVIDSRGCVSEDQVFVKVLDPIIIANTFTPNGDGINDTWNIPALLKYPEVTVDVYTRWGEKVFHSSGYGTPWDGTYQNKQLPVGVYYYIINTRFNNLVFSGNVTIVR